MHVLLLVFAWQLYIWLIIRKRTENPAGVCRTKTWRRRDCLCCNCQGRERAEMEVSTVFFRHNFPRICSALLLDPNQKQAKRNRAKYGVEEMCRDLWNWAGKNPYGYGSSDESSNWSPMWKWQLSNNFYTHTHIYIYSVIIEEEKHSTLLLTLLQVCMDPLYRGRVGGSDD
jgi:hypothetical protein